MSLSLTRQDFCHSVTRWTVAMSKGRALVPCLAREGQLPSTFRLLAARSSIRGQEKQYTHQGRPKVLLPSWHFSQVVNLQFRGALGRMCMARDAEISCTECIPVWQRRISTLPIQIPCDTTKLKLFTTFACLTTLVSIGVARTLFNEPAWDASSAFRQYILSWLYRVICTSKDTCSTSTTLWAYLVAMLVVVWQVRAAEF